MLEVAETEERQDTYANKVCIEVEKKLDRFKKLRNGEISKIQTKASK